MAPSNSPKYEIPALGSKTIYENVDPLTVRSIKEEVTSSSMHSDKKTPPTWVPGGVYDFDKD